MSTTTEPTEPAVRPGFYFRRGDCWVRVSDPKHAPRGVRVWTADELQALPDGRLVVRVKP